MLLARKPVGGTMDEEAEWIPGKGLQTNVVCIWAVPKNEMLEERREALKKEAFPQERRRRLRRALAESPTRQERFENLQSDEERAQIAELLLPSARTVAQAEDGPALSLKVLETAAAFLAPPCQSGVPGSAPCVRSQNGH